MSSSGSTDSDSSNADMFWRGKHRFVVHNRVEY